MTFYALNPDKKGIFIMECIGSCNPINPAEVHFRFKNYCPICLLMMFMEWLWRGE